MTDKSDNDPLYIVGGVYLYNRNTIGEPLLQSTSYIELKEQLREARSIVEESYGTCTQLDRAKKFISGSQSKP